MALPQGFVDTGVLYKIFPTATEFETRLVKDFEAFVEIADQVGEEIVFTVEERNRQLWGVAECQVAGELTPQEMHRLKDYISGQASDGWGEGFEQHEICPDRDTELYVHLWNSNSGWSIQTEEELFGQKQQMGGMTLG